MSQSFTLIDHTQVYFDLDAQPITASWREPAGHFVHARPESVWRARWPVLRGIDPRHLFSVADGLPLRIWFHQIPIDLPRWQDHVVVLSNQLAHVLGLHSFINCTTLSPSERRALRDTGVWSTLKNIRPMRQVHPFPLTRSPHVALLRLPFVPALLERVPQLHPHARIIAFELATALRTLAIDAPSLDALTEPARLHLPPASLPTSNPTTSPRPSATSALEQQDLRHLLAASSAAPLKHAFSSHSHAYSLRARISYLQQRLANIEAQALQLGDTFTFPIAATGTSTHG